MPLQHRAAAGGTGLANELGPALRGRLLDRADGPAIPGGNEGRYGPGHEWRLAANPRARQGHLAKASRGAPSGTSSGAACPFSLPEWGWVMTVPVLARPLPAQAIGEQDRRRALHRSLLWINFRQPGAR